MKLRRAIIIGVAIATVTAGCSQYGRKPEVTLTHTVKQGETAESIAGDYYGNLRRGRSILKFNHLDKDEVKPGTKLRLPMTAKEMAALDTREKARVPYNEGLNLVTKGSYLDATVRFRDAIRLDENFADAHYNLGVAYQRMKAYDRALDELETAIDLDARDPRYHNALGTVRFRQEDYKRAVRAFESALKLDPRHLKAQFSLAATFEKLGRTKDARAAWERYLELDGNSEWATRARENLEKLSP